MEPNRNVIIVDDDRETRESLAAALEWGGFSVTQAEDGLSLMSSVNATSPDVIVLDVSMSWMSGLDLCRGIKEIDELRQIPVVFISARRSKSDVAKGFEAGADDYFTKPVDVDRLLSRLGELTAARTAGP